MILIKDLACPVGDELLKFLNTLESMTSLKIKKGNEQCKNRRTIYELGIIDADTVSIAKQVLYNDYDEGPLEDERGYEGDVWVFKKRHLNRILYIKFNLSRHEIISFHWDGMD